MAAGAGALFVPAQGSAGEPAVLVDLGPDPAEDGGELGAALDAVPEIELQHDPGIRAALAGVPGPASPQAGMEALEDARAAYGDLDCGRAADAAARATRHLSAARAAGAGDGEELTEALVRAHVYEFLCAHDAGELGTLQRAAARLRNLGADEPPPGISDDAWALAPEIDAATDVRGAFVSVETEPSGAEITVDHEAVGTAPQTLLLRRGEALITAARDDRAAAEHLEVGASGSEAHLRLVPADDRWQPLRAAVAAWRAGRDVTPVERANFLRRLEATILLIRRAESLEVWGLGKDERVAERIATLEVAEPDAAAMEIAERVVAWEPRRMAGPDPDRPLLREDPGEGGRERERDDGPSWWVYASIGAAVGLGAAFVIGNDLAADRQRIELTWP